MAHNKIVTLDFETGPVTALSIISENLVLAGICGNLHVYDITKQKLIHIEYDLLNKQKIHGIKKDERERKDKSSIQVMIHGGKGLQILSVNETKGQFTGLSKLNSYEEFNDWIWDVIWLESSTIAMVTAHNVILLFDWSAQSILHQSFSSNFKDFLMSIRYSAHFIGTEWNNLILAAGTVFNQIVLWSPTGQADSQGHQKVIHRLEGHQGVIFSINYRKEYQLLATASDDRSIRLWKFKFETKPETASDWMSMSSAPLHTLYGHSARVWSAYLLHDSIISVGEDSTCCVWNYDGEVLNRFKGHKGKSIWSIDCTDDIIVTGGGDNSIRLWKINNTVSTDNNQQLVLSVPDDIKNSKEDIPRSVVLKNYDTAIIMTNSGSLCQYDINKKVWKLIYHNASFKSYSLLVTSPDKKLTAAGNIEGDILIVLNDEYICKRYFNGKVYGMIWIDSVHLLTTGPAGQILLLEVQQNDTNSEVAIRMNIKGEYILPPCKQRWVSAGLIVSDDLSDVVLVCGDRGGTVHHYRQSRSKTPIQSFPKIHGKAGVTSIIYRDSKILTAGRDGQYRIWLLDTDKIQLLNSHKVLKNLEWIDRLVLTGNNQLHVYGFHSTNFVIWSEVDNQLLLEIKCGGGHRSWDCKVNSDDNARFLYIKNGDVILHNTSLLSNQVVLKPALHGREVCDVKYIESININGDLYHLIVTTSEDTDIIISQLKVPKAKSSELWPLQTLQGHLSSVRTVTLNNLPSTSDRRQYLLFTGGGRAQIEIWKLTVCRNTDSSSMVCFNVEHEHLSSCFLGNLENKKGFKPWKKKHVNPDPETRILCLTSFCGMDIDQAYPASVHFVTAACSDGFVRLFCFNAETKTMELMEQSDFHNNCVLKTHHFIHKSPKGSQIFLLSGATEGVVAFWNVTKLCLDILNLYRSNCDTLNCNQNEVKNSKCDLISSDSETDDSCSSTTSKNLCFPTKIKHIQVKNENISEADVKDWQPCFKLKCHQSGINSLDTYKIDKNKYVIASGGDDNCLSVSMVSLDNTDNTGSFTLVKSGQNINTHSAQITDDTGSFTLVKSGQNINTHSAQITDNTGSFTLVKSGQNINTHSAQITGIRILSEDKIVTVSVDQRLNLWQLNDSLSSKDIQIDYLDCRFINISDIANLDIRLESSGRRLYYSVCGVGLAFGEIVIPSTELTL
ncbi:hypothetical protein LOTGIDRAFT_170485 [Lottia gigantea]|uniref:tRNA (34-2'-O)-methyltransferase regulator WDR6 n=1 Tax=Lottia gigantea TaxID=225164 RepID=V3ZI09_LOTGI|nr:hypothetical protein LOTGIDRAFT_170485 [Lottia gigantea]ESO81945.1 hypothetical protein LOTGIDRAFT_170485 [Lottia gigantea]